MVPHTKISHHTSDLDMGGFIQKTIVLQLKYSENFVDNLVNEQFLTKLALETVSVPNICIQECMV